jgi:WD40 repeat protein/serine/threonine protein kinase
MKTLTCSCGRSWEYCGPERLEGELPRLCPFCATATQAFHDRAAHTELPDASDPEYPRVGQSLGGFEILEKISRGAMGVVYKARQSGLNRLVALKVIAPELLSQPMARWRFEREVQAAARLNHPNIVTIYHTGLNGAFPYLAMEYIPGIDLSRLVKRAGPRSVKEACFVIKEAAQGLQHLFEQGLVHRDIKPANLMITPSPLEKSASGARRRFRLKILDMGLARVTVSDEADNAAGKITQEGILMGTPDYVALEQAANAHKADIRADLYSLGATAYFMLVGRVPFPTRNLIEKILNKETAPSVTTDRPDVPAALDALIKKLMAPDPAERFQTPAEVIAALATIPLPPARGRRVNPASTSPRPTASGPPSDSAAATTVAVRISTRAVAVQAHMAGIWALRVSADGRWLLTGGRDETLRLWDTARLQPLRCIAGDVGPVQDACLAPGGKWAASCALRPCKSDMVVQLWNLASGSEHRRLKGHTDTINSVAISPDGLRVASGSNDSTIRIWALNQPGTPSLCLLGHNAAVSCVMFLPRTDALISGGHDGMVWLWDATTGEGKGRCHGHVGMINALDFSPASKRIAIAGDSLRVRQPDGSVLAHDGHHGAVLCAALSPDGKLLLSGGSDGRVRLWPAGPGEALQCWQEKDAPVHAVAWSPDGKTAFSGSADGTLRRWPIAT